MNYPITSSGKAVGHATDIIEPLRRGLRLHLNPLPAHTIVIISAPPDEEFIFEGPMQVERPHTASLLRGSDTVSVLLRRPWPGGPLDVTDASHIDQLYRHDLRPDQTPEERHAQPRPAEPSRRAPR